MGSSVWTVYLDTLRVCEHEQIPFPLMLGNIMTQVCDDCLFILF